MDTLSSPGITYAVQCPGVYCDCKQYGDICRRGFFSLWIEAIYGKCFAAKLNIPCYINFGDKSYLYTDSENRGIGSNFWDYYYVQDTPQQTSVLNEHIETYPLRIWNRSHYRRVYHGAVRHLILKPEAQSVIQALISNITRQTTLGVHIRGTDHSDEVEPVSFEKMLRLIMWEAREYKKVFVATDDQQVLTRLQKELGKDRLIFQEAVRSEDHRAVHTNITHSDRYRLGLEVLADGYALSACDKAILVHSNVSYGALLLNPELNYTLLEAGSSRRKRLMTSFLYHLDQWGIRKM